CEARDELVLNVIKDRTVFVPTGFTPNGDNTNDRLLVHGRNIRQTNVDFFRIYDRWGTLLYEDRDFSLNDATRGWDGTFRGEEMDPGVYIWSLQATFIDGRVEQYKGDTMLIR
ncbi:MAG: gliding motility-associated C-terminal domain-containing protein, partial [Bacteroidota bacterium]